MTVVNAQNIQDAQDAKRVNPKAFWVGGAVTGQGPVLKDQAWIDVSQCPEMLSCNLEEGEAHLGAAMSLAAVLDHSGLQEKYPIFNQALQHIANPQTRAQATLAGALCQEIRCPYFKHEDYHCVKKGGDSCFAKGDEGFPFALLNNESCAGLHASTLGACLLAMNATMTVVNQTGSDPAVKALSLEDFFKVKPNSLADNQLVAGDLITQIHLQENEQGNTQRYFRLAARSQADWAEVEIVLNAHVVDQRIQWVRVVAGALARQPMRLHALEYFLKGRSVAQAKKVKVWEHALPSFTPLKGQDYRIAMLKNTLSSVFQEAF
jgi:xanthine dehydrogenase YagS FAD-binding subunit